MNQLVKTKPTPAKSRIKSPGTGFVNERYRVRVSRGRLIGTLRSVEAEVSRLEGNKRKNYAIGTFFGAQGFSLPAVVTLIIGSLRGAKARLILEKYIDSHKNHPRVAMFLAHNTVNPYLRKIFMQRARDEIMLRIIARSDVLVKKRVELNIVRDQMSAKKAVEEAYRWGVQQGLIRKRRDD